jgi:hypothetical protein
MVRKNTQSAADDGDDADDSFDGGQIEAMASSGSSASGKAPHVGPEEPVTTPDWTKRLSRRGKLARALIIALVLAVGLITLLPRLSLTLPSGIAWVLTPAPTHTPRPGVITSGPWEPVVGPPVQAGTSYQLTASSVDPSTAYACVFLVSADAPDVAASSAVIWITHDIGHTWQAALLPTPPGTSCAVTTALDGSLVLVSVDTPDLDQFVQACAHSRYFLSDDVGATWRRIEHASIAPTVNDFGFCLLWGGGQRLFMETHFFGSGDPGHTYLERSDDGGLTWTRADQGLAELQGNWYPQALDTNDDTLGALVGTAGDLWISLDAGASWQRVRPIAHDSTDTGIPLYLRTEVNLRGGPKACHCVYALTSSANVSRTIGQRISISYNDIQWTPLPPIPVTGTSTVRSGVYDALGATVDGKLLVLGADPSAGVPDVAHPTHGPPPRLWAWDTHAERWELAETHVPCQDLQSCALYATGSSTVFGANGRSQGTMFWLTGLAQSADSQTPTQLVYRLFIPAD